ncbi:MAG: catalase-peroxidase, partial [Actinomycetota bacterium]
DPVPAVEGDVIGEADAAALKERILASGLSVAELVGVAWASASSFRRTDKRGGANGARLRLAPQKDWAVNADVGFVVQVLEGIRDEFNAAGGKQVSLADLIVLAGCVGVAKAAKDAGHDITVPFTPGRTDATQEQTEVESFAVLEPEADGFRNYQRAGDKAPAERRLVDRAYMLSLTAAEMTALVGGMRALGANVGGANHGVLTQRPGKLTNDFFVNVLDGATEWTTSRNSENVYEGRDRVSGEAKWTATAVDLVFGSNSQLRALAEVYAAADGEEKFVRDFVAAWDKVMNLDRFDVRGA